MLKITQIKKTCEASPAQWEGKLDNGLSIYIRYRWGYLTVYISNGPTDKAIEEDWPIYLDMHLGSSLDGEMSTEQLISATSLSLSFPDAKDAEIARLKGAIRAALDELLWATGARVIKDPLDRLRAALEAHESEG